MMNALSNPGLTQSLIVATTAGLMLFAGVASAADLFKTGESMVTEAENDISVTNNFKYVNYLYTAPTGGETLHVSLNFNGSCLDVNPLIYPPVPYAGGVDFVSLGSRVPNGFTPKGVTGVISNVDGTTTLGTVTFDLTFDTLKQAGKRKKFGVAHIDLNLAVDDDCDVATDPVPTKVGIQVSASTAARP
jgi:hypothetical protein